MTRSTVKPDTIKLWQVKQTEEGLKLDISATWDAKQVTVQDEMSGEQHQEWEYESCRFRLPYDGPPSRAQNYVDAYESRIVNLAKARSGIVSEDYADQEKADRINATITHDDQIATLRKQIEELVTATNIEPLAEFSELQSVVANSIKEYNALGKRQMGNF